MNGENETINNPETESPDNLDKIKEKINEMKNEGEGAKQKNIPKSEPGVNEPEAAKETETKQGFAVGDDFGVEYIRSFYDSLFKILAMQFGSHWKINDFEADMLAKPTKAVLDKYTVKITPEGALILSAVIIVAPRVFTETSKPKIVENKVKEEKEEVKVEKENVSNDKKENNEKKTEEKVVVKETDRELQ